MYPTATKQVNEGGSLSDEKVDLTLESSEDATHTDSDFETSSQIMIIDDANVNLGRKISEGIIYFMTVQLYRPYFVCQILSRI